MEGLEVASGDVVAILRAERSEDLEDDGDDQIEEDEVRDDEEGREVRDRERGRSAVALGVAALAERGRDHRVGHHAAPVVAGEALEEEEEQRGGHDGNSLVGWLNT